MKQLLIFFTWLLSLTLLSGQINAKLFRYLDVTGDQITFVYGGDIWVIPKTGGTALQMTHSPGEESYPRFSPDGKHIAYTASYNGNSDVYVIPTMGGMPTRITYQSHYDRMIDWHPDGKHLIFASARESGRQSFRQFYKVGASGGFPEKIDIPYGELGSFSPDGSKLAYITKITENYPFKRYRGGLASDILIYDFQSGQVDNVTQNHANDGKPAWVGNKVYFLSDQGEHMRLNIWSYNPDDQSTEQITRFEDFDISYLSGGESELVFEMGGSMYLMDVASQEYTPVDVQIVSDLSVEIPRTKNVKSNISNMTAAPGGKRIVFEARGELFDVPVKEGYTLNLTRSSGAFDRNPSWSPDGKHVAYWSDKSGEYEIYLHSTQKDQSPRQLTKRGKGYGYRIHWAPDSKSILFIDEKNDITLMNVASGDSRIIANTDWNVGHGGRNGYGISWSADSRWITYSKGLENANSAIFIFDTRDDVSHQVTSGFYSDSGPVFSTDGKYLFFRTDRSFRPIYSDMGDGTWVYPNATHIASLALKKDVKSLLYTKNDELELKDEKKKEANDEKKPKDKKPESGSKDSSDLKIEIDFDNLESRIVLLPADPGNIGTLMPFEDKLVYWRAPNSGSTKRTSKLVLYDFKKREEKDVFDDVNAAVMTADGKSILVRSKSKFGIIKPASDQKIKDPIPTNDLTMEWVPRLEWEQIFSDTWRRHRDFFYDPNMHQLDWEAMRDRYGALLKDARTRWDVSFIQSNLASELSAGHTYTFGGENERVTPVRTGFLGIDFELVSNMYRIKRIVRPAAWDTEIRSPFDRPGVEVEEGDYVHAVNGIFLDPDKDPYAAFEGLSGKTVSISVSEDGKIDSAKKHVVKCLSPNQETQLRYLEWIENNRKMVDELSDGQLGYVYMSNTGGRGQLELVRMFYGQLDKKGFIIDERFNGGGQLADRFLELLKRPVVYNLHWRHGKDHQFPIKTNEGPMGMLINGWAGSGGDGLPWAFQELEAGPIVGERTLGILVGPATGHQLIDGGGITVPGARLYDNDGHWFWEGEGVAPDIEVWDDPNILMQGKDPQIERVVEEVLKLLKEKSPLMTPAPPFEDRTAAGLKGN